MKSGTGCTASWTAAGICFGARISAITVSPRTTSINGTCPSSVSRVAKWLTRSSTATRVTASRIVPTVAIPESYYFAFNPSKTIGPAWLTLPAPIVKSTSPGLAAATILATPSAIDPA